MNTTFFVFAGISVLINTVAVYQQLKDSLLHKVDRSSTLRAMGYFLLMDIVSIVAMVAMFRLK